MQKIRILSFQWVRRIDKNYKKVYDDEWYDQYAYDKDGWDRRWFNIYGVHRKTQDYFDEQGLDEWFFDKRGKNYHPYWAENLRDNALWYFRDMVCEFNSVGIHKITHTPFNDKGLNWEGVDKYGNKTIDIKWLLDFCVRENIDKTQYLETVEQEFTLKTKELEQTKNTSTKSQIDKNKQNEWYSTKLELKKYDDKILELVEKENVVKNEIEEMKQNLWKSAFVRKLLPLIKEKSASWETLNEKWNRMNDIKIVNVNLFLLKGTLRAWLRIREIV